MAKTVFLCHDNRDHALALAIRKELEDAGIGCWIAPEDVPPGTGHEAAVRDAIRGSTFFLALVSPNTTDSPKTYIAGECDEAQGAACSIFPVRVGAAPLPMYLQSIQALDIAGPEDAPKVLSALVGRLVASDARPLLSFSHPFQPEVVQGLEAIVGRPVFPIQLPQLFLDPDRDLGEQAAEWVSKVPWTGREWQALQGRLLLYPPALGIAAAAVLAYIHGLCGQFPDAVWRDKDAGGVWVVKQVPNLTEVRELGRKAR